MNVRRSKPVRDLSMIKKRPQRNVSLDILPQPKQQMKLLYKRDYDFYRAEKLYRNQGSSQDRISLKKIFNIRLKKSIQSQNRSYVEPVSVQLNVSNILGYSKKSLKKVLKNKSCCCEECGKIGTKQMKIDGTYITTRTNMSIKRMKLRELFKTSVKTVISLRRMKIATETSSKDCTKTQNILKQNSSNGSSTPNHRGSLEYSGASSKKLIFSQIKINYDTPQKRQPRHESPLIKDIPIDELQPYQQTNQYKQFRRVYKSLKISNVIDTYLLNQLPPVLMKNISTINRSSMADLSQINIRKNYTVRSCYQSQQSSPRFKSRSLYPSPPKQNHTIYNNISILQLLKKKQ